MTWNDVVFMLPEIILSIGASLLLIAPVIGWRSKEASAKWAMLILLAITALSVVICSNVVEGLSQTVSYSAMFALDGFAIFFKLLFITAIAMIVLLSDDFLRESLRFYPRIKRDLGIKDMGNLLPGHGGLMDRLDSLLPSAVAAWMLLTLFVPV